MINEDTLTLYFYDDGLSADERRQVETALGRDPVLEAQYAQLCQDLGQLSDSDAVPVAPNLLQRWHDSIDQAARAEKIRSTPTRLELAQTVGWRLPSLAWSGAIAAALTLGIAIGVYYSNGTDSNPASQVAHLPEQQSLIVPASFTRGLQAHLQDSQWEIARLPVDTLSDNTLLLMQIIQQNRMFERAASQNNSPNVARLLRAFEPILLRLASDDIGPEDAEALRAQLAFELNVMLTKLSQDTSKEPHSI